VPAALGPAAVDLGPLSPLATDPRVTDVLVNGPDQVWIDRGLGLERAPSRFPDDEAVRGLAVRLAAAAGRRLDAGAPCSRRSLRRQPACRSGFRDGVR
jgi:Flp pilus assembly CpaF family ATPase